jgi:hypothetical protein
MSQIDKETQKEINARVKCVTCGKPVYVYYGKFAGYKPYKSKFCSDHTFETLKSVFGERLLNFTFRHSENEK